MAHTQQREAALQSAKVRRANGARRRAVAAQRAARDAQAYADQLAAIADQLAREAWPNCDATGMTSVGAEYVKHVVRPRRRGGKAEAGAA